MRHKWILFVVVLAPFIFFAVQSFFHLQNVQAALEKSKADNAKLQVQLSDRLKEIETSKKEMAELHSHLKMQLAELENNKNVDSENISDTPHEAPKDVPASASQKSILWRSSQAVSDVSEEIALDEKQKVALESKFQDLFETKVKSYGGTEYEQAKEQILEEVLGAEVAQNYRAQRAKSLQKEFDERIDREIIILSNKLTLSEAQQAAARNALIQINHQLMPDQQAMDDTMRSAMATHFEGDSGKEKLQAQYDQIKQQRKALTEKRRKALFEALQNSLSDQQKNDLLEIQNENKE